MLDLFEKIEVKQTERLSGEDLNKIKELQCEFEETINRFEEWINEEYEYKDYRNVNSFLINKKSNISSYKELVLYSLKKENDISNFRDIKEVENWLFVKGLINSKIPDFLLNENYIRFNNENRIYIDY